MMLIVRGIISTILIMVGISTYKYYANYGSICMALNYCQTNTYTYDIVIACVVTRMQV